MSCLPFLRFARLFCLVVVKDFPYVLLRSWYARGGNGWAVAILIGILVGEVPSVASALPSCRLPARLRVPSHLPFLRRVFTKTSAKIT